MILRDNTAATNVVNTAITTSTVTENSGTVAVGVGELEGDAEAELEDVGLDDTGGVKKI